MVDTIQSGWEYNDLGLHSQDSFGWVVTSFFQPEANGGQDVASLLKTVLITFFLKNWAITKFRKMLFFVRFGECETVQASEYRTNNHVFFQKISFQQPTSGHRDNRSAGWPTTCRVFWDRRRELAQSRRSTRCAGDDCESELPLLRGQRLSRLAVASRRVGRDV